MFSPLLKHLEHTAGHRKAAEYVDGGKQYAYNRQDNDGKVRHIG
jgi:hypothetical protein